MLSVASRDVDRTIFSASSQPASVAKRMAISERPRGGMTTIWLEVHVRTRMPLLVKEARIAPLTAPRFLYWPVAVPLVRHRRKDKKE